MSSTGVMRAIGELPSSELAYRLRQQQLLSDFGIYALRCRDIDALMTRACELCAKGMNTRFAKVLATAGEAVHHVLITDEVNAAVVMQSLDRAEADAAIAATPERVEHRCDRASVAPVSVIAQPSTSGKPKRASKAA